MIDLKALRLEADLSQADLAEVLGVGRSYISKLERGTRQPDLWMVVEWARACGRELDMISPADAMVLSSLRQMSVRERRTLTKLIAAWDQLPETRRSDLRALVDNWVGM